MECNRQIQLHDFENDTDEAYQRYFGVEESDETMCVYLTKTETTQQEMDEWMKQTSIAVYGVPSLKQEAEKMDSRMLPPTAVIGRSVSVVDWSDQWGKWTPQLGMTLFCFYVPQTFPSLVTMVSRFNRASFQSKLKKKGAWF